MKRSPIFPRVKLLPHIPEGIPRAGIPPLKGFTPPATSEKCLTPAAPAVRISTMNGKPTRPDGGPPTMTELLRKCLAEAPSIRAVSRETLSDHASLIRFMRGESHLRLDKADALARYFGIECRLTGEDTAKNKGRR